MSARRGITGYVSGQDKERITTSNVGYGALVSTGTSSTITLGGVNYNLHTFLTDGSFTVQTAGIFDVLLVGGGGAAGNGYWYSPAPQSAGCSGGGGGGGVIGGYGATLTMYFPVGVYNVDVGLGGYPYGLSGYGGYQGLPGRPTRINHASTNGVMIEALGGGGGSGAYYGSSSDYAYMVGRDGAQGGGSSWNSFPLVGEGLSHEGVGPIAVPYAPTLISGRRGGQGQLSNNTSTQSGGGGGGAAQNAYGSNRPAGGTGGAGGNGLEVGLNWLGTSTYYIGAGGGGGGSSAGGAAGLGGVAGKNNNSPFIASPLSPSGYGINGQQPGAAGGGCCAGSSINDCYGGYGAPGAVWIRFKV